MQNINIKNPVYYLKYTGFSVILTYNNGVLFKAIKNGKSFLKEILFFSKIPYEVDEFIRNYYNIGIFLYVKKSIHLGKYSEFKNINELLNYLFNNNIYDDISFKAYFINNLTGIIKKTNQFKILEEIGFPVVEWYKDKSIEEIKEIIKTLDFYIDEIIVESDCKLNDYKIMSIKV